MAKKKQKATGPCTYCGEIGELTADHIPPQCIFPSIPKSQLIDVPACYPCNNLASKDDEWFRLNLVLREDVIDDADNQLIVAAVMRSFGRREAQGMIRRFLSGVQDVDVVSGSGLFIKRAASYRVDLERLSKVPTRIVKGLFWKHTGQRLSVDYKVITYAAAGFKGADIETCKQIIGLLEYVTNQQQWMRVGRSFLYSYGFIPNKNNVSVWITNYFKKISFISFTLPTNA